MQSWLIGKDSDAERDWGQEEKGTTEDEMAGWHHRLNGHEFGWTPGVGDGQGGLECCNSWGRKELDMTERLNWTELNWGYFQSWSEMKGTPLCLSLLQGIFSTRGLNPVLLHCRWILYQLSRKRSPRILEWIAYPFSSGSSWLWNQTGPPCIAGGFYTNWAIDSYFCVCNDSWYLIPYRLVVVLKSSFLLRF